LHLPRFHHTGYNRADRSRPLGVSQPSTLLRTTQCARRLTIVREQVPGWGSFLRSDVTGPAPLTTGVMTMPPAPLCLKLESP
jgi:hypothetical protein